MIKLWNQILKWFYPTTCIFCGKIAKDGICSSCQSKVKLIGEPRCKKCGKPIASMEAEYCYDCQKRKFHYEQGRSLWLHENPVSSSIYAYKYKNRRAYGEVYAKWMAEQFGEMMELWDIDFIVPVPIHKKRRKKRGYNQAEILAKEFGRLQGIPVKKSLVVRKKETTPQKELGKGSRRKNLRKAFQIQESARIQGNVLIIDDIYTTGSTIDIIAEKLLEAGCEKIYFLTISIGQGF